MLYRQPPGLRRSASTAFHTFESDQRLLLLTCMAAVASDTAEILQEGCRKDYMGKLCFMGFGASEAAKLLSSTALARLHKFRPAILGAVLTDYVADRGLPGMIIMLTHMMKTCMALEDDTVHSILC